MNCSVASSLSWSNSIYNPKMGITGSRDYCLLLKVKTINRRRQASLHLSPPKGEPRRFPHGWLKIYSSPGCPHYRSGPMGGRVHQKSSVRKVTHPSTIPALGGRLNFIVPMGSALRPWVKDKRCLIPTFMSVVWSEENKLHINDD